MNALAVAPPSLLTMAGLLTAPYRRGAETLAISLGADGADGTAVSAYDFREYRARHSADPPAPRYVVVLKKDLGDDLLKVDVDFQVQGATQTASLTFPAGAFAGTSIAIPLPADADASLRLTRLRQRPVPLPGAGAESLGVLALLGNVAKLLWVLSWEKDQLRAHLRHIQRQRHLARAHGASLDLLGRDLRVPRFPPREYSFDSDTLALYHLNGAVADGAVVADETTRFGLAGHPGLNDGAISPVAGKFGAGFGFPGLTGKGAIIVASHPEFDLPDTRSMTIEAFVNPDPFDDANPRMIALKGQIATDGTLTGAGWSLALASFRGIAGNARWALSDGGTTVEIFADLNLADGRFHHLAGVIDRGHQRARLFVDGGERAAADIAALGALTNTEELRIGSSPGDHAFFGVIDEVRLSKVARIGFDPVLGEDDDAYRRRLSIFERWLLPSPDALAKTINGLVQIQGNPESFVLIEKDRPTVVVARTVRIVPGVLAAGESLTAEGDPLVTEAEACGTAEDDRDFDPIFLQGHARSNVDYGADPDHRRMHATTKATFDELCDRLAAAQPPIPGKVVVDRAYQAAGPGLHRVGRSLQLHHETEAAGHLAAFAHAAGFDFVRSDGATVTVSVVPGDLLTIAVDPRPPADTPPAGIDVFVRKAIDLELEPASLPAFGEIRWALIRCGAGRGRLVAHPDDPATLRTPVAARRRLRFEAEAPGEIALRVEYKFRGRIVGGGRTIQIGIESLADQASIAADGDMNIAEPNAVGPPDAAIDPIYLVTSNVVGVDYGTDPNNKRMQIGLERPFKALLAATPGLATGLQVLKAFDPADPGLHKVARALRLTHAAVAADRLGALAHHAGFGFVLRQGTEIYASVAAADLIEIARLPTLTPLEDELFVGQPLDLSARFDVLPPTGDYTWSLFTSGRGDGSFDFTLRPQVRFTPRTSGVAVLSVTYLEPDPDAVAPYTFEIRLNQSLETANAPIPKDQYDLIMNVLNYFHPVGVEVVTSRIRKHVVEIEQDPQKAFPAYTYPDFRV